MSLSTAVTKVDLEQYGLKKIASGKVREIFEIDDKTLLFVATDRISAYDVILDNVSGKIRSGQLHMLAFIHGACCSALYIPYIVSAFPPTLLPLGSPTLRFMYTDNLTGHS